MGMNFDSFAESFCKIAQLNKTTMRNVCILLVLMVCHGGLYIFNDLKLQPSSQPKVIDWNDVLLSRNQADLPKALRQADELLAENPGYALGYYRKGEILLMLRDKEGALQSFKRAYDILPIDGYKRAVEALRAPESGKVTPSLASSR